MSADKRDGNHSGGGGLLFGLVIGVVLTFLYVKYDFALPAWLQPADKVKGLVITTTASISADNNDMDELQREIAVKMKESSDYYTSIDDSLGKFITEEIVWRGRTKRTLKLLQDLVKNLDSHAGSQSGGVNRSIERLLHAVPQQTKNEHQFAYQYLKKRFPGLSDTEIVEELKRISLTDLFQISYPSSRIVFALPLPGTAKIDIYDASRQKVKTLLDAALPSGQFRLYWDFTNDDGVSLAPNETYSFEIYVNGAQTRAEIMEVPGAVWN